MEQVSILEFRKHAEAIIAKVRQGKHLVLTYRGKPVIRLEPITDAPVDGDDPFYSLPLLATASTSQGKKSITNEEIDEIVYGK
ncbi:MAG: type II toxin-antitoxin system Phd/YefM family antitoxin [Candidatus Obscuribacterales bacterium]